MRLHLLLQAQQESFKRRPEMHATYVGSRASRIEEALKWQWVRLPKELDLSQSFIATLFEMLRAMI